MLCDPSVVAIRVVSIRAASLAMNNDCAVRCVRKGAVARAFESVCLVEANVCVGGGWLKPPKV
jgi:hypothetical protein